MWDKPISACGWSSGFSQGSPAFTPPYNGLRSKWMKKNLDAPPPPPRQKKKKRRLHGWTDWSGHDQQYLCTQQSARSDSLCSVFNIRLKKVRVQIPIECLVKTDQTAWMARLIWVLAGPLGHFMCLVVLWLINCRVSRKKTCLQKKQPHHQSVLSTLWTWLLLAVQQQIKCSTLWTTVFHLDSNIYDT